jgi:NAD dependent epimerase/dehydratase family enzyme
MNIETRTISQISHRATRILFEKMGGVDTIRFLNQFSIGLGDYTKDREEWLSDISLDDVISQMKVERK